MNEWFPNSIRESEARSRAAALSSSTQRPLRKIVAGVLVSIRIFAMVLLKWFLPLVGQASKLRAISFVELSPRQNGRRLSGKDRASSRMPSGGGVTAEAVASCDADFEGMDGTGVG